MDNGHKNAIAEIKGIFLCENIDKEPSHLDEMIHALNC
jgi:hypothetical protein